MYIIDGIAYAKEEQEFIEVVDVKVLDDMILILKFNTGEQRVFDATILKGEVFKPLRDKEIFNNVQIDCGVVTWMDGDIDCAPEYMYENSYEYSRV